MTTQTIPASDIVQVTPGVIAPSGVAIETTGLFLTTNTRVPIGVVLQFPSQDAVGAYFGLSSNEYTEAGVYFGGYVNCTAFPAEMLFSQYPTSAVSAYLRGGSVAALTLTQLQSINGSLSVTIDSVVKSGTVNLSTATTFSNAAELIGNTLGIEGVSQGTVTGSIGGTATCTAVAATKVLTLVTPITGSFQVGDVLSGTDGTNSLPSNCTIVNQINGTPGEAGTYLLSAAPTPGNLTSCTVTSLSKTLNVTADVGTVVSTADVISGSSVTAGTYITSQISGTTGGVGLYAISSAQTVSSESITVYSPGVTYDSVSGGFVIISGTTGASSTITFATGAVSSSLYLTQASGAVTSQGSAAYTPSAAMDSVIALTTDWVSFTTLFDPDGGSGNTIKLEFALWTSQQNDRYLYVPYDTDITPTETVPDTTSMGYILNELAYSGTAVVYEPSPLHLPAFIMGCIASIDFTRKNGRITLAYKSQGGITPSVTSLVVAQNLKANYYNFYGIWGTATQQFQGLAPGSVSGPFDWIDTYVNQIWMNANFQAALMNLLFNVNSVPYDAAGRATIEAALAAPNDPTGITPSPIADAINFGSIVPGVPLSSSQISAVNTAAGANIAGALQTIGWYLQIQPASPSSRLARSTPPMTLWYCDGGSVQQLNLASIVLL